MPEPGDTKYAGGLGQRVQYTWHEAEIVGRGDSLPAGWYTDDPNDVQDYGGRGEKPVPKTALPAGGSEIRDRFAAVGYEIWRNADGTFNVHLAGSSAPAHLVADEQDLMRALEGLEGISPTRPAGTTPYGTPQTRIDPATGRVQEWIPPKPEQPADKENGVPFRAAVPGHWVDSGKPVRGTAQRIVDATTVGGAPGYSVIVDEYGNIQGQPFRTGGAAYAAKPEFYTDPASGITFQRSGPTDQWTPLPRQPYRQLTVDDLIAGALQDYFKSGETDKSALEKAFQLDDFAKRPSQAQRLELAIRAAQTPADYLSVVGMMRGEIPITPSGSAYRLGPQSQAFDNFGYPNLFGGVQPPTQAQTPRVVDVPNQGAPPKLFPAIPAPPTAPGLGSPYDPGAIAGMRAPVVAAPSVPDEERIQETMRDSGLSREDAIKALTPVALAGGTAGFRGGLALVGEKGPELVSLPKGTRVTPLRGVTPLQEGTLPVRPAWMNQATYDYLLNAYGSEELRQTIAGTSKGPGIPFQQNYRENRTPSTPYSSLPPAVAPQQQPTATLQGTPSVLGSGSGLVGQGVVPQAVAPRLPTLFQQAYGQDVLSGAALRPRLNYPALAEQQGVTVPRFRSVQARMTQTPMEQQLFGAGLRLQGIDPATYYQQEQASTTPGAAGGRRRRLALMLGGR